MAQYKAHHLTLVRTQAEKKSANDEAARRQYIKDTKADLDRANQAQLRQKAEAKARGKQQEEEARIEWTGRVKELKKEVSR